MGTPGSASGLKKRTCGNTSTALQVDSTGRLGHTEQVPLFVFYAGYGAPALIDTLSGVAAYLVVRIRDDPVFYTDPDNSARQAGGASAPSRPAT